MEQDTIFAPATAPGRAALAIVRISGPHAFEALRDLAGNVPPARRVSLRVLQDSSRNEVLDEAMVAAFPGPASATGEDLVELYLHGGRAVLAAVCGRLGALPGLRLADPGEFTRRAFLNDRIDLTRAEGILDLVDAETDAQRRQAIAQATGGLEAALDGWREVLVAAMARLEAFIDFPDEDLPETLQQQIRDSLSSLEAEMDAALVDGSRAERIREGLRIAIVGVPNAGKSSLLNWLAKRDVAIVSATAGTTRDVLEVHLDIDGYAATVADTAGLRETPDEIEAEGVRRALARAEAADLTLVLADAGEGEAGRAAMQRYLAEDTALAVATKIDLIDGLVPEPWIGLSTRTGAGTQAFMAALAAALAERMDRVGSVALNRARHREAVAVSRDAVRRCREGLASGVPLEIAAEDLRLAAASLGRVLGRVDVEEILDRIFGEFCLGK
ncbi:tRNA uridine-5-carboxymethylaminomethyl(34) synthesis GTPase MnmE [Thalassobaculum sp. OXR-137]|uniref:tRNA uridine-5-carboxymethylaminomethyl(34) synthesis GTPase MnmE n=1 Tax=Thalassobaculum sp. OXR-137 TaxID=3100173 RepID=UPI002AC9B41A|nr:tRNA uridine-5-carboxymethylaminomethyl(34) synthesis GTPase MnmE [Thalassobaculum sp. OXR-137]WPZ35482.1 tRNA uridine-5-carboxymethylaminomethyl(34) synthesis GTPase MnmE [Thalassobaculum sp. OXR-137]